MPLSDADVELLHRNRSAAMITVGADGLLVIPRLPSTGMNRRRDAPAMNVATM
jgi:hypothetical protein